MENKILVSMSPNLQRWLHRLYAMYFTVLSTFRKLLIIEFYLLNITYVGLKVENTYIINGKVV